VLEFVKQALAGSKNKKFLQFASKQASKQCKANKRKSRRARTREAAVAVAGGFMVFFF